MLVAPRLVMVLQTIRDHFGAAVTINSGYRDAAVQCAAGRRGALPALLWHGSRTSWIRGEAGAVRCARKIMPDWGGSGGL